MAKQRTPAAGTGVGIIVSLRAHWTPELAPAPLDRVPLGGEGMYPESAWIVKGAAGKRGA